MEIQIFGDEVFTKKDFHNQLANALNVEQYYGQNLDALWDIFWDIERPVTLTWHHSEISKQNLGEDFDKIINVLQHIQDSDNDFHWAEKFTFYLAL